MDLSLDGGDKYKKYEKMLRLAFKKEGVNGSSFSNIDKRELKSAGIADGYEIFIHTPTNTWCSR